MAKNLDRNEELLNEQPILMRPFYQCKLAGIHSLHLYDKFYIQTLQKEVLLEIISKNFNAFPILNIYSRIASF